MRPCAADVYIDVPQDSGTSHYSGRKNKVGPRGNRRAVNNPAVIVGNENDIAGSRLDNNLAIFVRNLYLIVTFQASGSDRMLPQRLHGIHDIVGLIVVSVTESRRP
jgi:hypothetical protein